MNPMIREFTEVCSDSDLDFIQSALEDEFGIGIEERCYGPRDGEMTFTFTFEDELGDLAVTPIVFQKKIERVNEVLGPKLGIQLLLPEMPTSDDYEVTFYARPLLTELNESEYRCGILELSTGNSDVVAPHWHYYYLDEAGNGQSSLPNTGYAHRHIFNGNSIGDTIEDSDHFHKIGKMKSFGPDVVAWEAVHKIVEK